MDEISVSFQMVLILLSFLALGSESQISVFKQCQSSTQMSVFLRGSVYRSQNSVKKTACGTRSFQFLASFVSFYFEILSYLACGEKIIRLASKTSVKLGEKSASDF